MRPSTTCQHNTLSKQCSISLLRGSRTARAGLGTGIGAVLLVAMLGTPSQGRAPAPSWGSSVDVDQVVAPPIDVTVWTDQCLDYLRRLLQLLGGNPGSLNGDTPVAAMGVVYEQFEENGIDGLIGQELIEAISITAKLDAALAAPPEPIDPSDFNKLREIEGAFYSAK